MYLQNSFMWYHISAKLIYYIVGNHNLYLTNENEKIAIEAMGATIFSSLVQKL